MGRCSVYRSGLSQDTLAESLVRQVADDDTGKEAF